MSEAASLRAAADAYSKYDNDVRVPRHTPTASRQGCTVNRFAPTSDNKPPAEESARGNAIGILCAAKRQADLLARNGLR